MVHIDSKVSASFLQNQPRSSSPHHRAGYEVFVICYLLFFLNIVMCDGLFCLKDLVTGLVVHSFATP